MLKFCNPKWKLESQISELLFHDQLDLQLYNTY